MLLPLETEGKRKAVSHGKFFFFDVGIVNALLGTFDIGERHPLFGKNFEHLVYQELAAYIHYYSPKSIMNFWRTHAGDEVDFVINRRLAVEVKATRQVVERDLKSLRKLSEETKLETKLARKNVVSRDEYPRRLGDVEVLPVREFLQALWAGNFFP
jgi:uncharacterized protein